MEIEQGTFTPLVFTTTGGMADECVRYHNRLAELIANKKGESYSSAISWIRAKVSFAIVRSAILCLRGSRSRRRQLDFVDSDLQIENINLFFRIFSKELEIQEYEILFFLTCFLFNIRDGFVMTQFKTLDCLQKLLTASEQQGMYLRNRY